MRRTAGRPQPADADSLAGAQPPARPGSGQPGFDDAGFTSASACVFRRDGAALHPGAAEPLLAALDTIAASLPQARAGIRLHGLPPLAPLLTTGPAHAIAAAAIGSPARPVRAILFDKTRTANWSLGWHQDRTIVMRDRRDVAGFGPWSRKAGRLHVEPPFAVISAMVTLRIHLDDVPADNAPLLIAPGSHRLGRIAVDAIDTVVERCGIRACLGHRGDIWCYATPIVHASGPSRGLRRRVLQVDYSADMLPGGLEWLGV